MKVFIASDHAGFSLKRFIKENLQKKNIEVIDCGAHEYDKDDDYPRCCFIASEKAVKEKDSFAVVIGGSGLGEAISANKVKGIRCAVVYDRFTAIKSREHNNANCMALRARGVPMKKSLALLNLWLNTKFSGAKRHVRRIRQISYYEGR